MKSVFVCVVGAMTLLSLGSCATTSLKLVETGTVLAYGDSSTNTGAYHKTQVIYTASVERFDEKSELGLLIINSTPRTITIDKTSFKMETSDDGVSWNTVYNFRVPVENKTLLQTKQEKYEDDIVDSNTTSLRSHLNPSGLYSAPIPQKPELGAQNDVVEVPDDYQALAKVGPHERYRKSIGFRNTDSKWVRFLMTDEYGKEVAFTWESTRK